MVAIEYHTTYKIHKKMENDLRVVPIQNSSGFGLCILGFQIIYRIHSCADKNWRVPRGFPCGPVRTYLIHKYAENVLMAPRGFPWFLGSVP